MIKRISTVVAVVGAASIISGCSVEQPSAGCFVQDASFALWAGKYTPTSEAEAAKTCGTRTGEALGVWKFFNPDATAEQRAQSTASKLAIRPRGAASITAFTYFYQERDEAGTLQFYPNGEPIESSKTVARVDDATVATNISSTFPEEPDAEGMCKASGFAKTRVDAREVRHFETNEQLVAPASVEYEYTDVEVYSAPAAPGTQLRGKVKIGDGAGCTAEYEMWALWPLTGCDPAATRDAEKCGEGSGINPDFDVTCDTKMNRVVVRDANTGERWPGVCVPARRPPSFKNQ